MRYARSAVLVGLFSTVLTSVLILYPLYIFEILRIPRFLPLPMLGAMLAAAGVNMAVIAVMAVLVAHKVAGPMFSLVRSFRRAGAGQLDCDLNLREGDELKFVVRNFNDMLRGLRQRAAEDLELLSELRARLRAQELAGPVLPELEQLESRLRQRIGTAAPASGRRWLK